MALDLSRTIVKSFRLEKALFDVYEKIKENYKFTKEILIVLSSFIRLMVLFDKAGKHYTYFIIRNLRIIFINNGWPLVSF